jgi:hypothetical protein
MMKSMCIDRDNGESLVVFDKGFLDLLFRCCTVHILSFS